MTLRCVNCCSVRGGVSGGASYQPVWFNPSGTKGGSFIKNKVHSVGLCVPETGSQPRGRPGGAAGAVSHPGRSAGKGWGGVSPAWNSCGCPCGVLSGNPARPAGRTDAPCGEDEGEEFGKEKRKERNGQGRGVPGRRQPRPPAWGEAGCPAGSRVKGRAGPQPRARPPPALPLHPTQCVPGTAPSGNTPNIPANRRETLLLHPS